MQTETFHEINVTNLKEERLQMIYWVIMNNGWSNKIDELEMVLDDSGNILVRGWATKSDWSKFYNTVIASSMLDYLFMD